MIPLTIDKITFIDKGVFVGDGDYDESFLIISVYGYLFYCCENYVDKFIESYNKGEAKVHIQQKIINDLVVYMGLGGNRVFIIP